MFFNNSDNDDDDYVLGGEGFVPEFNTTSAITQADLTAFASKPAEYEVHWMGDVPTLSGGFQKEGSSFRDERPKTDLNPYDIWAPKQK